MIANRLTVRCTTAEWTTISGDANQSWKAGDMALYTDAAAGAVPGVYCTTGGAGGGTAVFKALAVLAS